MLAILTSNLTNCAGCLTGCPCCLLLQGLLAWGDNSSGQLGVSAYFSLVTEPARVPAFEGSKIDALSAGEGHSAAVTSRGVLWAWGDGSSGQLGLGGTPPVHPPMPVSGGGLAGESMNRPPPTC